MHCSGGITPIARRCGRAGDGADGLNAVPSCGGHGVLRCYAAIDTGLPRGDMMMERVRRRERSLGDIVGKTSVVSGVWRCDGDNFYVLIGLRRFLIMVGLLDLCFHLFVDSFVCCRTFDAVHDGRKQFFDHQRSGVDIVVGQVARRDLGTDDDKSVLAN